MSYLVKSKTIDVNFTKKDITKENSVGHFYSGDRFYTLLNDYLDSNLKKKSIILYCLVVYLFRSSNYKHDPSIANGRAIWPVLVDIFCVFCFIAFLVLFILSFGLSFIKGVNFKDIANAAKDLLNNFLSVGLPMLIPGLICGIIGIFWLIMFFKIRKKNAALSLKDYVLKKVGFILKLRWMIKVKGKTFDQVIKSKKDLKIIFLEKFEGQGGAGDRWLNIQLINLLASIFSDFNLVFKFDELSDDDFNELNDIFNNDFKNLDLTKIK